MHAGALEGHVDHLHSHLANGVVNLFDMAIVRISDNNSNQYPWAMKNPYI